MTASASVKFSLWRSGTTESHRDASDIHGLQFLAVVTKGFSLGQSQGPSSQSAVSSPCLATQRRIMALSHTALMGLSWQGL